MTAIRAYGALLRFPSNFSLKSAIWQEGDFKSPAPGSSFGAVHPLGRGPCPQFTHMACSYSQLPCFLQGALEISNERCVFCTGSALLRRLLLLRQEVQG